VRRTPARAANTPASRAPGGRPPAAADPGLRYARCLRSITEMLRNDLTPQAAASITPLLPALLGGQDLSFSGEPGRPAGVGLTDGRGPTAWAGHRPEPGVLAAAVEETIRTGRAQRVEGRGRGASLVTGPLVVGEELRGVLVLAAVGEPPDGAVAAELADLLGFALRSADGLRGQAELAEARLRSLRAQISPHFIGNALTAIASFVETDPDRARLLLLDFADFARYTFGRLGSHTTLAEEIQAIEIYLRLEQARFADRLRVRLKVAPDVLPTPVPFLVLQPLVENAVRHGLAPIPRGGTIRLTAVADGPDCVVSVEDDGVGMDPRWATDVLAGRLEPDAAGQNGVGLRNVDERLRHTYGAIYGLVVETYPGAGTKVTVRLPRWSAGVLA